MSRLLDLAADLHAEYVGNTTREHRKQNGQVFTPPEVARFMASLLDTFPEEFRLLDPGAGAGSLTVAVCQRVLHLGAPRKMEFHVFETEPALAQLLRRNLEDCKQRLSDAGHSLSYTIHEEDFIAAASPYLDRQLLFDQPSIRDDFDAVIMNPPYFKVRKDSAAAKLMAKVVHGQPNAYAFFLTLAAQLLKENGTLVAITPRSFCNGLYFRGFRRWFFQRMALDHIHLFESRTDTFKDSGVLQESVITKSHRVGHQTTTTAITSSYGKAIGKEPSIARLPTAAVVDNSRGEYLVKIPVTEEDRKIMRLVESLPTRFDETGLGISTGPVVTFRATELLLWEPNGNSSVPLLMPHNVKPFKIVWPVVRKQHPVAIVDSEVSRRRKLLLPTQNYVVLKRFSAKEEKRRLTAGCLLQREQQTERTGLENHLNYVFHASRELSEDETFGIAPLFNSVLFDRYFRILSGNTQVNATEIRNLHFPSLDVIAAIGKEVRTLPQPEPSTIEAVVFGCLDVGGRLLEHLAGSTVLPGRKLRSAHGGSIDVIRSSGTMGSWGLHSSTTK